MFDRKTDPQIRSRAPLLSLDYGVDEQICETGFNISERGMRFISRWQFSIGTQLAVACVYKDAHGENVRVRLEGTVVWCEPCQMREGCGFDCTLLFLELPDELKQGLREFAHQVGSDE
jgi:hypothetical protein